MLQTVHISHDGFRQVGQIAFAEIAERQFPQTFRNADTHILDFAVDQSIGR